MFMTQVVVWILSVCMMALSMGAAHGQTFPTKPIRILTAEAGGGNDFAARLVAHGLTQNLGQQVIVENRGGGGGTIGAEMVAKAPPDGYTLLLYAGTFWYRPFLRDGIPYDPVKDYVPITTVATSPNLLVVPTSLPVKSVKELIALAKSKPGQLNYGSGSTGTSSHLGMELLKAMAGVDILRIAYKGNGPALIDVMSGQTQMMIITPGAVAAHLKSGKLRALAVTSLQPSKMFPDLPTVSAAVPGYQNIQLYGMFAPAKTPAAIVAKLNQEIVRAVNRPDVKEKFVASGQEVDTCSPAEFATFMKEDMGMMGKVIKDAGIREE
jgi:tripartite-type tricarboxylate transporter receptor subunit TctC